MKFKSKIIAALVAVAASASAHADMSNFISGNSSVAFVALDSTGSPISFMADLGNTLDTFLPSTLAANSNLSWNFNTNTFSVNGVAQAGTYSWSDNLTAFAASAQSAETKWGVIAGDQLSLSSSATPIRYLTTSTSNLATVDNQTLANLSAFSSQNNLYNAANLDQTDGVIDANTATSGAAYVGQTFGVTGNWGNRTTGYVAFADVGVDQNFYFLNGVAGNTAAVAQTTQYAGVFNYDAGVLTYSVAAVPEPETYAMMLGGLGMLGFMARRRLNRRA